MMLGLPACTAWEHLEPISCTPEPSRAADACNQLNGKGLGDNDCYDFQCDKGTRTCMLKPTDDDRDGHYKKTCTSVYEKCLTEMSAPVICHGWAGLTDDCDDSDPKRNPKLSEQCDGIDNNCDTGEQVDEGLSGCLCKTPSDCGKDTRSGACKDRIQPPYECNEKNRCESRYQAVDLPQSHRCEIDPSNGGCSEPTWDWNCDGSIEKSLNGNKANILTSGYNFNCTNGQICDDFCTNRGFLACSGAVQKHICVMNSCSNPLGMKVDCLCGLMIDECRCFWFDGKCRSNIIKRKGQITCM